MIYVFLADGFEEMEALAPVDILRRCELDVKIVGVGSEIIRGSHGIAVLADIIAEQIVLDDSIEMIVLPGGMPGTLNLEKSLVVQKAIDYCVKNNIYIGAICAAPSILGHKGLLEGYKATCFIGFENQLIGAEISSESVVVDRKIITARSAGFATEFSLKLAEILTSKERAELLRGSILCE